MPMRRQLYTSLFLSLSLFFPYLSLCALSLSGHVINVCGTFSALRGSFTVLVFVAVVNVAPAAAVVVVDMVAGLSCGFCITSAICEVVSSEKV